MKLTLLGTGCAGGLPVYGCDCAACSRATGRPDYRRRQCSAMVEAGDIRLLLDAGLPDLPERFPPGSLTGILLTHYHVDHVQGLFHWRWGIAPRLSVYGPDDQEGCADLLKHPGFLDFSQTLAAFEPQSFSGAGTLTVTPLPLAHSRPVLGYCFDYGESRVAYLTDTIGVPEETRLWLKQHKVQTVILDCTHPPSSTRPRNHNDLTMALEIFDDLQPERLILTHISHDLDCWLMKSPGALPAGVSVGRDQEVIE
ncbi:MAG: phosphonate metabolism protein PhnP [Endozoicomonas sp.]